MATLMIFHEVDDDFIVAAGGYTPDYQPKLPSVQRLPVRNEALALPALLDDLAALRLAGAELIVVDGGSDDASCASIGSIGLTQR